MKRFSRCLSLLLVFCLASTFTLACALACDNPPEVETISHCHQAEPASVPAPGLAFDKVGKPCPILTEWSERQDSLAAPAVKKVPVLPVVMLPFESLELFRHKAVLVSFAPTPEPPPLPIYLQRKVLRV